MEGSGVSAPLGAPTDGTTRSGSWVPANPAPLGLAGFAMTTFVLSMMNANWVSPTDLSVVLGLALAYGGVAQLLAGMWEFRAGNTFGAVAFSSFGAFWISYWLLVTFNVGGIPPANVGPALGLYLWAWAIFTAYMTVAALRVSVAVLGVFVLLTVTFVLLAIGASGNHTLPSVVGASATHWGGYLGVATAIVAWYASFAAVVNSTFGKTVAPVFPLNR
jgi:succinate-acetate transporter protein